MSKLELNPVTSGYNLPRMNENFQKIEDELKNKVVYRDEASPMDQNLDMNNFGLINVDSINGVDATVLDDIEAVNEAKEAAEDAADRAEIAAASAEADAATVENAKLIWRGEWNSLTAYEINDAVSESGSSYIAIADNTNIQPPNASYWEVLAMRGSDGAAGTGTGDASTNTAVSVDNEIALFSGTSGKILKRAFSTGIVKVIDGVMATAVEDTDYRGTAFVQPITLGGTGATDAATARNNLGVSDFLVPTGAILPFAMGAAPTGWLALPTTPTNISRATYSALFSAIGTTWGVGDGATTFGMPYLPTNYVPVQANGNVGTATVGQVIAHSHDLALLGSDGVSATARSGSAAAAGTAQTTSTGGSANLAAGIRFLWCVKI